MTIQSEYQSRKDLVSTSHAFGMTDVGCVRDHNEDALRVDAESGLYIVADGMGGHAAGEVASAIVLEMVPDFVRRGQSLDQALCETHRAIQRAVTEGRGAPGMGSTAVVLRMDGADYEVAWVGDSRAYLWDGTRLRQLSRDHSFVQKLLEAQAISAEEAEQHPDRNVITQALGMVECDQVRPDTVKGRLYRGERILLCSDGLSSEVADDEITVVLASHGDNESQARSLIEKARRAGGADNITVLLVRAPEYAPRRPSKTEPFDATRLARALQERSRRRWWIPCLAIGVGVLGVAAVGWMVLREGGPSTPAGGGATAEPAQRTTPALVPEPPMDAAASTPRLSEVLRIEPEKQQRPGKQGAPVPPAEVITIAPLKPRPINDEGAARAGNDVSGLRSKRKD